MARLGVPRAARGSSDVVMPRLSGPGLGRSIHLRASRPRASALPGPGAGLVDVGTGYCAPPARQPPQEEC